MTAIFWKLGNSLAYVFLLGTNLYSDLGPNQAKSPYFLSHTTYITPAYFTFYVWFLIHLLLGGFVIYQFFPDNDKIIAEGINFHFFAIALLNSLWLFLWEIDFLFLGFIVILFVLLQISYVYWNLKKNHFRSDDIFQTLFIHAPFSLYHAWILIIAVLTIYATFTPARPIAYDPAVIGNIEPVTDETITDTSSVYYESPTILVQILVILGLLFMECTAIGYIEKFRGDLAGAAVIAWTLYGVWSEQQDAIIRWTAFVLALITTLHILKPLILKYVFKRDDTPIFG
ncbi:putative membrane permease [Gigaspora margarita]|uniref:Putative membrane permease n=1 Tax=Gigaspora margarita TaxID=4874 RepID=A0A8H3WZP4_GIGMA|nr:putative membrane permease [Gigaspora margarita]